MAAKSLDLLGSIDCVVVRSKTAVYVMPRQVLETYKLSGTSRRRKEIDKIFAEADESKRGDAIFVDLIQVREGI